MKNCSKAVTFQEAKNICKSYGNGSKLCSKNELVKGKGKNTGCNLDFKQLWSSTTCDSSNTYFTVRQSSIKNMVCNRIEKIAFVRCCTTHNF
jgi:hypothetical protein